MTPTEDAPKPGESPCGDRSTPRDDEQPERSGLSELPAPDFQATLSDLPVTRPEDDHLDDPAAFWGEGQRRARSDRFQILRPHAKGGHGEVFVALDTELNREVALKTIQTPYADDPRFRSRFLFEAEVTGRLEHPGIVPVYGLGRSQNGRPYYAMRFVEGKIHGSSLKDAIRRFHDIEKQPGRSPGKSDFLIMGSVWASDRASFNRIEEEKGKNG